MGILNLFKSNNVGRKSYEFSDEDRNLSAAIRKEKQNMKLEEIRLMQESMRLEIELKNAELRARIADYLPESEEGNGMAEQLFMPIITKALGGLNSTKETPSQTIELPPKVSFTEEQLRTLRDSLPRAARKYARTCDDDTLKKLILSHIPAISSDDLEKAVVIARE